MSRSAPINAISPALEKALKDKPEAKSAPETLTAGIAAMKFQHPGLSGVEARRAALKHWPVLKRFTVPAPKQEVPAPIAALKR